MDNELVNGFLSDAQVEKIKEEAAAVLKSNPKAKKIIPIAVKGNSGDTKDIYVGYFKQPGFISFSKYISLVQKDSIGATRELAKDCFLDGDKELVDDDDLFLFGTMGQITELVRTRDSAIVNL